MPLISPTNPYPTVPTFKDIPGVDRPTVYATTSSNTLPSSVSTPATQRIGMPQEVQTASSTSLALTGSDGARLGIGERVGAVTVFGTDINPGSATQAVDSRRQGTSVSTFKRFDNLIYPLMRVTDKKLTNKTPFVNFKAQPEAYGQPKLFHDPEDETAKYAFLDIPGDTNSVTYIKIGEEYLSYPLVLSLDNYKEPDQIDGVIEVFDVRKSFAHTSITDYNFMKGAHSDLGGGFLNNNKGTSKFSNKFEYKKGQSIDFFEASNDVFFAEFSTVTGSYTAPGLSLRKFAGPGLVSTGKYIDTPFSDNEAENYTSKSYGMFELPTTKPIQATLYDLLYGNNQAPYSKMSDIGTRFKSGNCGLQFGESNPLGTDSIAFGGLKK
jgi:hypothetical protein